MVFSMGRLVALAVLAFSTSLMSSLSMEPTNEPRIVFQKIQS